MAQPTTGSWIWGASQNLRCSALSKVNHPSEGSILPRMCVLLTVWGHVQVITISRSCPSKSQQIIVLQPQAQATDGADTKLPWAAANIYHFPNHSCWPRFSIQFPQWQPEFDSSYSEISSEFEAATVWCLSFTILWQQKSVKVQNSSFRRFKFHLCL